MATVSFASAHTPLMQPPPASLLPAGVAGHQRPRLRQDRPAADPDESDDRVARHRGRPPAGRDRSRHARPRRHGLIYDPEQTDTMVIIVGDNGTLGSTVKLPFDPTRAKGTAYQTGVWVPLVVAGPLVNAAGPRRLAHGEHRRPLQLFGEIAGIDVPKRVPRTIDSVADAAVSGQPEPGEHPQVELHPGRPEPAGQRRPQRPLHHRAAAARRSPSRRASARTTTASGGARARRTRSPPAFPRRALRIAAT